MKTTHQLLMEAVTELSKYDNDRAIEIGEQYLEYQDKLMESSSITF